MLEQQLFVVVFVSEKFCSYFIGMKVFMQTNHVALRYLMEKKDVNPRLIHSVFLLQKFDFEVKD